MDRGADQHEIGPEILHQVELALDPVEGPGAQRVGQSFEVAERLEQGDVEPMVAHHRADFPRAAVEGDEILLEDLDPVETCGGNGSELFAQIPGKADGGDGGLHAAPPLVKLSKVTCMRAGSALSPVNSSKARTA